MTDKRGPKGVPIRLGDDFNEEEATVLDVSLDGIQEQLRARQAAAAAALAEPPAEPAAATPASGADVVKKRAPPPSVADDDLEKTEMLERPDLDDGAAVAPSPRGVVPLGSSAARLLGKTGRMGEAASKTDSFHVQSDEAETLMLTRPPSSAGGDADPLPLIQAEQRAEPPVRALDDLSLVPIGDDASDDKTLSRPKIARMTFRPEHALIDEAQVGFADTAKKPIRTGSGPTRPAPRPLPPPAGRPIGRASKRSAHAEADSAERTKKLIVEAPPGAAVFVDGTQRGTGVVEVSDLDPFARVAVRVHHPGYKPWHRSLSLDGEDEIRVTPDLEPR